MNCYTTGIFCKKELIQLRFSLLRKIFFVKILISPFTDNFGLQSLIFQFGASAKAFPQNQIFSLQQFYPFKSSFFISELNCPPSKSEFPLRARFSVKGQIFSRPRYFLFRVNVSLWIKANFSLQAKILPHQSWFIPFELDFSFFEPHLIFRCFFCEQFFPTDQNFPL